MGLYLLKFPYRKILLPLAKKLKFINPDILSYLATILTLATAYCFYQADRYSILLLWVIGFTFLRMTLNTMDGVIAIERGNLSLTGEIVNALPDRYSDIIYMLGITLSPLCGPVYGFIGLASMFLVSYTGMLGKALGVEWQHHGPLGKVERLILIMICSLWQYILLRQGTTIAPLFSWNLTPLQWGMVGYLVLGQITVVNRLKGMLRQIGYQEWFEKEKFREINKKVLLVYDSQTGNTQKIATVIGACLNIEAHPVDKVKSVQRYDLVVLGTPNIRGGPTPKINHFLNANQNLIKEYAVFITYGMPLWGPLSTWLCTRTITRRLGKRPRAVFSSRGFHVKFKTYPGRPNQADLGRAFRFGCRLARKLR